MTTVTRDTLDAAVEFDSPFTLTPNGDGTAYLKRWTGGRIAPDAWMREDGELEWIAQENWEPVDGHSSQQGYTGPIMHSSETLSGGMAARIIAEGGTYAVVAVEQDTDHLDPDSDYDAIVDARDNPAGWALMRADVQ